MVRQNHAFYEPVFSDARRHYAQLRGVVSLIEQIAGRGVTEPDRTLDETARIACAYDDAPPIVQRRFDTLAAEISAWAAAGADALSAAANPCRKPRAAAATLAEALEDGIKDLKRLLRV